MNQDQLDCYLAGAFDGEGCVSIHLFNYRKQETLQLRLQLSVSMCDPEAVQAFYSRFGGLHSDNLKTYTGRIQYRWRVINSKAIPALSVFSKWCRVKKRVIDLALPVAYSMLGNKDKNKLSEEEKTMRWTAMEEIGKINGRGKHRVRLSDFPLNKEAYFGSIQ